MTEGYLELCFGPMFSGKTTQLIKTYKTYTYIEKKIAVVNYADDTRYHDTMLSTHDLVMVPCIQTKELHTVLNDLIDKDIILINEGQFFQDIYEIVLLLLNTYRKKIYIYALDGDFMRNKFGKVLDLIPYCDKVNKMHALCSHCKNGKPAIFSHRISAEVQQVVIGSQNYMPLCRQCYDGLHLC